MTAPIKEMLKSDLFVEITKTTWNRISFDIPGYRFFLFEDSFIFASSTMQERTLNILIIDVKKTLPFGNFEFIYAETLLTFAPEKLKSFIVFNIEFF
jgi:hypothetical protein